MVQSVPLDRRKHARKAVEATARLAHDTSGRGFRCRCVDISAGGARLLVPAAAPLRAGHAIHLQGAEALAEYVGARPADVLAATVVRVTRRDLPADGDITVAVQWQG